MFGSGTGELHVLAVRDLGTLGLLVEQIEHARARGERFLQRGTQTTHGHYRAKGRNKGENGDKCRGEINRPRSHQLQRTSEHHQVGNEDERVGRRLAGCLAALEACIHGADLLGQLAQSAAAIGAAGKLNGLGRAAQAVEHKGTQLAYSSRLWRPVVPHALAETRGSSTPRTA